MTRSFWFLAALALSACSKRPPEVAAEVELAPTPGPAAVPQGVIDSLVEQFNRVQFDFDSATLTEDSKAALAINATILQKHPRLRIEVQGHADERGTTDYNLALGDRRANAVTSYLQQVGVSAPRLTVISFGEERPRLAAPSESAWSANRRCEFRILTGDAGVVGTVEP